MVLKKGVGRLICSLTNGNLDFVADFGAGSHGTVHMHDQKGCREREPTLPLLFPEREPTLPPLVSKGEDTKKSSVECGCTILRALSVFFTLFEYVFTP